MSCCSGTEAGSRSRQDIFPDAVRLFSRASLCSTFQKGYRKTFVSAVGQVKRVTYRDT